MKNYFRILTTALILFGLSATAGAYPTISITPTGTSAVAIGDTVSFNVLFTAGNEGDSLTGLSLQLGYDATELNFVSYSYETLGAQGWSGWAPVQNVTLENGSFLADYNLDPPTASGSYDLGANQSVSMGTFTFEVTEGLTLDGLSDLWIVDTVAVDGFNYDSIIAFNDNFGVAALDLLTAQGTDLSPTPVPSTLLLLCLGSIAFAGTQRKKIY